MHQLHQRKITQTVQPLCLRKRNDHLERRWTGKRSAKHQPSHQRRRHQPSQRQNVTLLHRQRQHSQRPIQRSRHDARIPARFLKIKASKIRPAQQIQLHHRPFPMRSHL